MEISSVGSNIAVVPVRDPQPTVQGLTDSAADKNAATAGSADSQGVLINQKATDKQAKEKTSASSASSSDGLFDLTGTITLDADKNVVVQFVDKSGKVVSQYPPEDYLQMMKELNKVTESLFHKTA